MPEERRVALVTGANRGIGKEVSRQLADAGLVVLVAARDLAKAEDAVAELGGGDVELYPRELDVTDDESVGRCFTGVRDEYGRLDVLVNNAGIGYPGMSAVDADLDEVKVVLETNLFGAWRCAEHAVPLMRRHGYGRIVNVSTGMAQLQDMGGGSAAYRVSKTSLNALTRMLAAETRGDGIKVNSVCPGWVRTDMGGPSATRSVEQGADTITWAATLPDDGPTGGFFRDRAAIPW
jgi:NAD(P)-dependent dehydrogenase (short-subunit alcohol dehydrogenase family)